MVQRKYCSLHCRVVLELVHINDVTANNTSLVIAHRLSTIVDADNIIVMCNGKIVEQGTHEALLELNAEYASLWRLQQSNDK